MPVLSGKEKAGCLWASTAMTRQRRGNRSREDQAIQRLTRSNNLIFVAALLLSQVFSWSLLFALLFWLYLLFRLIRRDRRAGKVSAATMVYGALALAVAGFVLYVLVYSALR